MKRLSILLTLVLAALLPAGSQPKPGPFAGRWDVTVTTPNSTYPGWLEVVEKGGSIQARVQPREGSVHPVKELKVTGTRLILTLEPAEGTNPDMRWELSAAGEKLSGELKRGDKTAGQVTAVRAPELERTEPRAWTEPEPLFNGRDLTGWEPTNAANSKWVARDGVLVNQTSGSNLKSTRKFDDFRLHIEVNCPQGGNSGIYLRGR